MDTSKSPIESKTPDAHEDRISNLPSNVTEKILKCLPLPMAAKMSSLSTYWRDAWVSHRYLVFDKTFWAGQDDKGKLDAKKVSNIITSILLHHSGPLHKFHLYIPTYAGDGPTTYLSQWLSFLSRTCVKKVALLNWHFCKPMPYHLYACKELVKLRLEFISLNPPPISFKGFPYLRSLELVQVEFKHDILESLISSCPRLTLLWLEGCIGLTSLAIDAPSLESLVIKGVFATLYYKNVARLSRVSLCLVEQSLKNQDLGNEIFNSVKLLATTSEIQCLQLGGHMCKALATGGVTNLHSLAFRHLKELCLTEVDFGDLNVFCFTLGMIQSCPCIKDLEISVSVNATDAQHKIDLNDGYKQNNLVKMKITGITGSSAELKFLEHMLSISVMLEFLYYNCRMLSSDSELKVSRDLLRLRRASAKAQLVCLDQ